MSATKGASRSEVLVGPAPPSDAPAVEAFVAAHPHAAAYHRPVFAELIRRAAGLEVETFAARGRGGAIAGILPVALTRSLLFGTYATSLPYFNYGGALVAPDAAAGAARALVDAAWGWAMARGARHIVLRHTLDRPLDGIPFTPAKETATLALPAGGPDALWERIGAKPRNLVRKAERAALAASSGVAAEDGARLGAFHAVLSENMRDLGSPVHGIRFYRALAGALGAAAEVHLVRAGAAPDAPVAAAALTIRFRDRVEVPWASCLRRFNAVAANMLLYWHLLRRAAETGARVFDFGRSTPGSGPWRFKMQWGARPEPLPWYWMAGDGRSPVGDLSPQSPRFARAVALWRRLPVPLARLLGARLAPALP